jgi:hypothetical protein
MHSPVLPSPPPPTCPRVLFFSLSSCLFLLLRGLENLQFRKPMWLWVPFLAPLSPPSALPGCFPRGLWDFLWTLLTFLLFNSDSCVKGCYSAELSYFYCYSQAWSRMYLAWVDLDLGFPAVSGLPRRVQDRQQTSFSGWAPGSLILIWCILGERGAERNWKEYKFLP